MSGLVKAKKYDWKDSNMALFGSDTEKAVKKEAAEKEPAWKNAGKRPGLQVWRINKFKVEAWPTRDYGKFFDGDSYIILNTYKEESSDKLLYDVHFWIGKHSTQDEYGTAAYKTVELDTLLDDVPVQHREVQEHESDLFSSYFKTITYMHGGADSGFKHVKPEEYKPRLFNVVKGKGKNIEAKEVLVKVQKSSLTPDDCYVLDDGNCFFLFKGSNCNPMKSYNAATFIQREKSNRPDSEVENVSENEFGETLDKFHDALERVNAACDDDEEDDDLSQQMQTEQREKDRRRLSKLFRLSDAGGELQFSQVKEGSIVKKDFDSKDVFIFDTASHGVFVWTGRRASDAEKGNGMCYAHKYLKGTDHFCSSVTVLTEVQAQTNNDFKAALTA